MKVVHYKEVPPIAMNSEMVRNVAGRVLLGSRDGAPNFCMRRFEIGPEGYTPKHSHAWEHEVYVVQGQGQVFLNGQWQTVTEGTAVLVPPNAEHQFKNESDATFAFLCLVPSTAPEI